MQEILVPEKDFDSMIRKKERNPSAKSRNEFQHWL